MQVCVLGATGGTGREATRAALDAGHGVRVLVRDPTTLGGLGDEVEVVRGELGLRDRITRADLGRFLVDQLTDGRFVGAAPFVSAA